MLDGQPVCDSLRCHRRPGGPPVTNTGLRKLALSRYLREAADRFAWTLQEINNEMVMQAGPLAAQTTSITATAAGTVERRNRKMTNEFSREVAVVYMTAPSKPTAAVQRAYGVARPTASRWVRAAKDRDFITDPTKESNQ